MSSLLPHLLSSVVFPLTLLSSSDVTSVLSPLLPVSIFPSTYGPSTSTLIRLYKSYTRSLFDYGAPATRIASPDIQLSWGRKQTHFISRALSIPSFIHNDRKRKHAYLPPIDDRNLYLAKRCVYYLCLISNTLPQLEPSSLQPPSVLHHRHLLQTTCYNHLLLLLLLLISREEIEAETG